MGGHLPVGAVHQIRNARHAKQAGIGDAFIHEERSTDRVLYRVRIGPVADVVQYDVLVEELENVGITDPYLITE